MLLVATVAFAQSDQPAQQPAAQPPAQPPASQPAATPQTPRRVPAKAAQSLADVARASKRAHESAPPTKVYRNKDVRDPADVTGSATPNSGAAVSAGGSTPTKTAASPQARTADEEILQKEEAFETQGKILRSQVLAQMAKIAGIKNNIQRIQDQFVDWTTWYSDDGDVSLCWTSQGDTYYYKSYCDVGKNISGQAEAAQRQLAQEKTNLENMQEDIRRKGYGNAIYEPE